MEVAGFAVPQLSHHDDRLWVVEMGIVSPPFVLDFAGAYLDRRPDYPDDVMEEWQAEKLEQFGEERWQIVQSPCQRRTPGCVVKPVPGKVTAFPTTISITVSTNTARFLNENEGNDMAPGRWRMAQNS